MVPGFPCGTITDVGRDGSIEKSWQYRKRRGAGERWRKPFNGYPADDRLRDPHPVPRTQLALEVREIQASVSPTPFVVDPGVAPGDCTAILRSANLHLKSPGLTGSVRRARSVPLRDDVTSFSSQLPCASQEPSSSRRSSPLPSSPYCPPSQV